MRATAWAKTRAVNQTSNGYVSKIATATEPSGDAGDATGASVHDLRVGGVFARTMATFTPYGIGADDSTFSMRVIGWSPIGTDGTTGLWIPTVIAEFLCTLSTSVGVAAKIVLNTERFADTITLVDGNDDVNCFIVSPEGNINAHVSVMMGGAQKFEVSFTTGGSATSCNAIQRLF